MDNLFEFNSCLLMISIFTRYTISDRYISEFPFLTFVGVISPPAMEVTSDASWDRVPPLGYPTPPIPYPPLNIRPKDLFNLVHLRPYLQPVLTSSGGHQNTHSSQAGSTHPPGMLSSC